MNERWMPRMSMPTYRRRRMDKRRRAFRFPIKFVLLLLLLAAMLAYPFVEARLTPKVDRHNVLIPNLDPNLKNLKIAYVTDIHQSMWFSQARVNDLIRQLNGLSADIVILGGDYATDSYTAIRFFENLPPINARIGTFAVFGSSDRDGPDTNLSRLMGIMNGKGITPLVNNTYTVKRGKAYLTIAGADDMKNGDADLDAVAAEVKESDYVIFVGHSPDLLTEMRKARGSDGSNHWFDVALFGSTHGGQINVFGKTPFAQLRPRLGNRYTAGWLEENRANILVSRGVGTSFLPARLFARPEIHFITLKSR